MFRCYFCNQITPAKTPRHSVTISKREKHYPTRRREAKGGRGGGRFRSREGAVQDHGGKGIEIAQEVSACPTCAAKQHEAEVIALPVEVVETVEATAAPAASAEATSSAPVETKAAEEAPAAAEETPAAAEPAAAQSADEKAPEA